MSPDGSDPSAALRPRAAVEAPFSPETTIELLDRVKAGDTAALNRIVARCLPALERWAHGRLPAAFRDCQDTADLVQETILATLRRLDRFEARHEGALQAYLRQALANRVRDVIRKKVRLPRQTELSENIDAHIASPLEEIIGQENLEHYEAALSRLRASDRDVLVARIELQYTYEELAVALGKPSANAARVAVNRAIRRLADEMRRGR